MAGKKHKKESIQKISETRKLQFANGWKHPLTGIPTSKTQRQRTSEVNSNTFTIKRKDKPDVTVTGLNKWCVRNGYNSIALTYGMRIRGYYKDIISLTKHPK